MPSTRRLAIDNEVLCSRRLADIKHNRGILESQYGDVQAYKEGVAKNVLMLRRDGSASGWQDLRLE